jgi:hypothetical protein
VAGIKGATLKKEDGIARRERVSADCMVISGWARKAVATNQLKSRTGATQEKTRPSETKGAASGQHYIEERRWHTAQRAQPELHGGCWLDAPGGIFFAQVDFEGAFGWQDINGQANMPEGDAQGELVHPLQIQLIAVDGHF